MRSPLADALSRIRSAAHNPAYSNPYQSLLEKLGVSEKVEREWLEDKVLPTPGQLRAIQQFVINGLPTINDRGWLRHKLSVMFDAPVTDVTPLHAKCGGYPTLRHYIVKTVHNELRETIKNLEPEEQEEVYRLAVEIGKSFIRFRPRKDK